MATTDSDLGIDDVEDLFDNLLDNLRNKIDLESLGQPERLVATTLADSEWCSSEKLARLTGLDTDDVGRIRRELVDDLLGLVRPGEDLAGHEEGDERHIRNRMSVTSAGHVDRLIVDLLYVYGSLTTPELAERTGVDRARVYRRCRRIESGATLARRGRPIVSSRLVPSERKLYFFPATGAVLTKSNFRDITRRIEELKAVLKGAETDSDGNLTTAAKKYLKGEFRKYFLRWKEASPRQRHRISRFEGQLMAALRGTTIRDIAEATELKVVHPKVRKYEFDFNQINPPPWPTPRPNNGGKT